MSSHNLRFIHGGKTGPKTPETELVVADAVLALIPGPAALWNQSGDYGVLNDASKHLLGFTERRIERWRWSERIHPLDRDAFNAAWKRLEAGEGKVSCEYRVFPVHSRQTLRLIETSRVLRSAGQVAIVWSFYTAANDEPREGLEMSQMRELLSGLAHEVGNALQTIRGEIDLLRLAGGLSQQSSSAISCGVQQMRKIAHEIQEYLSAGPSELKTEDPAAVLNEVIQQSRDELSRQGIRMRVVVREPLPKLPLDCQFRSALRRVIEFSRALLPEGGELTVEAGLRRAESECFVELNVVNASPTQLQIEEKDVFRPFVKVNDCSVGLSMAVARQILRRHFGKIAFRKEQRNRGVFSIDIRVPKP
ncbi:MAG TPA: PAS domain-containing protein [Candidatus Eisenbacteria bacterium]|nr:PAS domain-containing protein [Candidatus Eisenbacteria bacterium]